MADDNLETDSLLSIFRGAGFFITGKAIANFLGFLTNLLLTRGLGPALFGYYTLGMTIIQVIGSIANLGADKAVLRFVGGESHEQNSHLGLSFIVAIVGGVGIGAAVFVASPWIASRSFNDPLFVLTLRLLSILMVLNALITISGNAFRAIDRPELDSLLKQIVRNALIFASIAVAYLLSFPLVGFVIAVVVATALTLLIGGLVLYSRTELRPSLAVDSADVRPYLTFSIPLAFKDVGSALYTRVDILIVSALLTASAVGFYRIAILLSTFLTIPIAAVNQIFPPIVSRLYHSDERQAMARVYKTVTRWILTGTLPAAVVLLVYRIEILQLFGTEFTEASAILIFLTIGQLSNALVGPSGFLLMMTDRQFVVTANQLIFGATNIVLNVILINLIGLTGAAIATSFVLFAINITRLCQVYYFNRIHPFSISVGKPIAATFASALSMLGVQAVFPPLPSLAIGSFVGVAVYLGFLAFFGLETDDRELVSELVD